MSDINFNHSQNVHTQDGPRILLPIILEITKARSLLDVGCGIGFWLKTALELGLTDLFGVDGVNIPPSDLAIPQSLFRVQDLTVPWSMGRKYDLVLCLEVAEHLAEQHAAILIDSLVSHADTIVFSAACPFQEGQNHINCQWPVYWQRLFNERGFACSDELRGHIWCDARIEPWYRQNIFIARRVEQKTAGKEARLRSMVHPESVRGIMNAIFSEHVAFIREGGMSIGWYLKLPFTVFKGKLKRKSGDSGKA
ncbi:MAG: class I SAM-dependent methyltransferase [Methylacidiphilales bacterium]|nr:class I SAM-dependent methyltransferase [Candidatus Methylacidiphilales bacterium]